MKTVEDIVTGILRRDVYDNEGPATTNETGWETDTRWTSVKHMLIVAAVSAEYGVKFDYPEIQPCAVMNVADLKRLLVKKGVPL